MSKMTELEFDRLEVAEFHVLRALSLYKSKPRKGRDLERLKLLETAANALNAARLANR